MTFIANYASLAWPKIHAPNYSRKSITLAAQDPWDFPIRKMYPKT